MARREGGSSLSAMNTNKRVFVGLVSSLLLAAGLSRAAERLDPLSHQLTITSESLELHRSGPGLPCATPCVLNVRPLTVSSSMVR